MDINKNIEDEIIEFVYRFGTLDQVAIQLAIPEASALSPTKLDEIITEDYSRADREIEYDLNLS